MAKKHAARSAEHDGEDEAMDAPAERLVMVSGEQQAREQYAREVAEMRANPIDESARPGGLYRVGGKLVDANGQPVKGAEG